MNAGRSSSNLIWRKGWDEGREREEKEDDDEGRKEGMNSKEVSEPERFHSGNRFLIVERNMASAPSSILPEHETEDLDIYAYHRTRSSISFCFC